MAKTNRATGTSTAAAPKDRAKKSCTALVTTAELGETMETSIAIAVTASTTPRMSVWVLVSAWAGWAGRRAGALPLPFPDAPLPRAAFEVRFEGI